MSRENELNVGNNQSDKNRLVSHVKKLVSENPNITDSEMRHALTDFLHNEKSTSYSKIDNCPAKQRSLFEPFNAMIPYSHFFSTRNLMNEMTNTWNNMNRTFSHFEQNFDKELSNDVNDSNSYVKYVSSMTTYDTNGLKTTKSVSGIEKMKDGKRSSHKKMTTTDVTGTTIEEIYPDGTKRVTTKKALE
jgi:hypothetical protein